MAVWVWTTSGLKARARRISASSARASCSRADRLAQLGEEAHPRALLLGERRERVLAGGERAVDEQGLVAVGVEAPAAEQRRLVRRPAHVEAADYAKDAQAASS